MKVAQQRCQRLQRFVIPKKITKKARKEQRGCAPGVSKSVDPPKTKMLPLAKARP